MCCLGRIPTAYPEFFSQPVYPVVPRPEGPDIHSENERCVCYYSISSGAPLGKDRVANVPCFYPGVISAIPDAFKDLGWATYALGRPEWRVKSGVVSSGRDGEGPVMMEHPVRC